jgi:hypothetical protein
MSDNINRFTPGDFNRVLGVIDHPVNMPVWSSIEHCPMPVQPYLIRFVFITYEMFYNTVFTLA